MLLILVRHAEAEPGKPDELRPLTASGHEAARLLGELLAERGPDAVVSSPLVRARLTAEAIAAAAGTEAAVDEGLAPGATLASLRGGPRRPRRARGRGRPPARPQRDLPRLTGEERSFPTAGFAEIEL